MAKKKIYVLFTRFNDNGTKAISALTGSRYPHTSIGLEEDMNTFYSFVTKGFIVENVTRYVKPDKAPYPCQLYEIEVTEDIYKRIKEIIKYFIDLKCFVYYTKLGLTLSVLHIPYKRNRLGYFCSQFVAHVLQHSGAVRLKKGSQYYFSNDLKQLPGMQLVFRGNLKSMIQQYRLMPCLT